MQGILKQALTSLDKMLGIVAHKLHLVLNGKFVIICLGYILGYWKGKGRLWTRDLDTINSNFFLFINYSFYYIVWRQLCSSSFQEDPHICLSKLTSLTPLSILFPWRSPFPVETLVSSLSLCCRYISPRELYIPGAY